MLGKTLEAVKDHPIVQDYQFILQGYGFMVAFG